MGTDLRCWCGNEQLEPFSDEYLRCPVCESLVLMHWPEELTPRTDDDQAYYGKEYWFSHQEQDLGLPNILTRSRTDLIDRVPYWVEVVLRHRLPPGRVLELGSSHGGFVAALRQVGFEASGLELSPWVVDFARKTFEIPVYVGPVEQQDIIPGSLDILLLMDVIEHLPDPIVTLGHAVRFLNDGGLVVIQTPLYPAGKTYSDLLAVDDPFLEMLIPGDHLHLFSSQSLKMLLESLGMNFILSEPPLFQYDQFFFASNQPVAVHSTEKITQTLQMEPRRRLLLALIDLYNDLKYYKQLYHQADIDRVARLEIMQAYKQESIQLETDLQSNQANNALLEKQVKSQELDLEKLHANIYEYKNAITQFQSHFIYRVLRRLGLVNSFESMRPDEDTSSQPRILQRVVIDLTPVRPGGENGGMKLAAIELVKNWSNKIAPQVEFILLTSSDTHDELAFLDRANVQRMCVNQISPSQTGVDTDNSIVSPPRSPVRKIIHIIAQIFERILPREVFRYIYRLYHNRVEAPKSSNLIRSLNADVVFCPFTAVFYHAPEVPTVVVVADLQYIYYPQFFTVEQNYHSKQNFRKVCQVATRLICLSDFTRQSVLDHVQIEPERVVTSSPRLWNPLQPQSSERVNQLLTRWNLQDQHYLFFPANFWPHKNHEMLLTAFNLFCRSHPENETKLVLAGAPGKRMDFLRLSAERMGLADKIVFTGYLNAVEMSAVLQGCMALIFPSLFEGFGIPVIEAMHFGKPVLCSTVTSLPEVCGEAALYFDPRRPDEITHAIERIVFEEGLAESLAREGQQQAEQFSNTDQWAQDYFKLIEDAFQGDRISRYIVSGIQPDGWAGNSLEISIPSARYNRILQIQFDMPAWHPKQRLSVDFAGEPLLTPKKFTIPRGKRDTMTVPLNFHSGLVKIKLAPTIVPKQYKLNDDTRSLSCFVKSCRIISEGGKIDFQYGEDK